MVSFYHKQSLLIITILICLFSQTTPVIVGLGLAAVGIIGKQNLLRKNIHSLKKLSLLFEGRSIIKHAPTITKNVEQKIASMPKPDFSTFTDTKHYKGGFEKKMTRREAALILGVR